MRLQIFAFIFLLFSFKSWAQIDTEFWFAGPEVTQQHADRPILLRITAMDLPAVITISQPANPHFAVITQSIAANSTISVDMTKRIDLIENKPANAVLNKGLYIKATAEITVYYEVLGSQGDLVVNSDIFTLKGKNALGTSFYTPFQNHWDNVHNGTVMDAWSSIDIVATEDSTLVTITPTRDVVGHSTGIPFTVLLNTGQTYSARATSFLAADHPTGTLVTSNKPIAVTIKDDSLFESQSYDLAGDQLIPVNLTGTDYIAVRASTSINLDRVFICATQNSTDIFISGNTSKIATINAGETFEYLLDTSYQYIHTSLPAYVFHVCGFYSELGGALLPPIGCSGSRLVGFTRSTEEPFALCIIVKSGGENFFKLNGSATPVAPNLFEDVPGTGGTWKAAKIFFSETDFPTLSLGRLTNDSADFQLGVMNGYFNTGFRYGFFSDYAGVNLGPDKTICRGDSVLLYAGFGKTSYLWSTGAHTPRITVKDSATYSVTVTKGGCSQSDDIKIKFFPPIGKILGNDTSVCSNLGFQIKTDTLYRQYVWNTGATSSSVTPAGSGTYWIEVTDKNGCRKKDSIYVTVYQVPNPKILFDTDLGKTCWDSLISLQVTPAYVKYKWNTGDTTQSIITPHLPEYDVIVTDINQCVDSANVYIDCSPYVKVYNLFTPNGDGLNDSFYVEGLQPRKWSLEIYDRWGGRVYYNENYNNDFYGHNLDTGIYYYSLRHHEDKASFKGWVHILR